MIVLTLRTDKPEAEIGLFNDSKQLSSIIWQAHRQLAETLHLKIEELLSSQKLTLHDVQGIVTFKGPGSFTGLRIGLSVGNALAYGLQIPIVAQSGDDWLNTGLDRLSDGKTDDIALPEYGMDVHITPQKR